MEAKEKFEQNLGKLFKSFRAEEKLNEIVSRGFVYAESEKNKKILFVGINPSYSTKDCPACFSYIPKYDSNDPNRHAHFKKYSDLAKAANLKEDEWTSIDLLFVRETNQRKVLDFIKYAEGLDFICEQLRLTMSVLEELEPELIVVCNKGAGRFFGKDKNEFENVWMGYEIENDKIVGIHPRSIKSGSHSTVLKHTPIIFTSALTYMKKELKKNLIEQIKAILREE